jgi:hypothetical protein
MLWLSVDANVCLYRSEISTLETRRTLPVLDLDLTIPNLPSVLHVEFLCCERWGRQ